MNATAKPVLFGHLGKRSEPVITGLEKVARSRPGVERVLDRVAGIVFARGGKETKTELPRGAAWGWSTGFIPNRREDLGDFDHILVEFGDNGAILHGSQSGTLPLYILESREGVTFSSDLDALINSCAHNIKPDYAGLGQMIAASGPFSGRTTVAGIQRVQPGEVLNISATGEIEKQDEWRWSALSPRGSTLDAVREALWEHIQVVTREQDVISMLSGGWDSRLLLAGAFHVAKPARLTAYTTSSDTGTVMEELVAAQVADHLEINHHIAFPERSLFLEDFRTFGAAVDYQTAFHVWLMPLLRAVRAQNAHEENRRPRPLALDGLGGGLFIGSSFSDEIDGGGVKEGRLRGITRYLNSESRVLRSEVANSIREQVRSDAVPIINRYLNHPYGHTLSAYVARTLPGISHAPHSLMSEVADIATPFVAPSVVQAALEMPLAAHKDDRLYGELLQGIDPVLARLTTAQEQVPWPRPHPRRIASIEVVRKLRGLVSADPVKQLVRPEFLQSTDREWQRALTTTADQHVIRGLAMLNLWHEQYHHLFSSFDLEEVYR